MPAKWATSTNVSSTNAWLSQRAASIAPGTQRRIARARAARAARRASAGTRSGCAGRPSADRLPARSRGSAGSPRRRCRSRPRAWPASSTEWSQRAVWSVGPGERLDARDVGQLRLGEDARGADHEARRQAAPVGELELPDVPVLVEARGGDLRCSGGSGRAPRTCRRSARRRPSARARARTRATSRCASRRRTGS